MSRLMKNAEQSLAFDVLAEIAAGTTARIELCRVRTPEEKSGMLVAVKRLHKHIAEDPQFANMFFDEVWMTAALHHQNVVDVVGWGNDSEGTYLAVELVQGVSLARLMKTVFETGEMFSERMVVYLGSEICAGLSAAHALHGQNGEHLRLVHRDLTPGNVLIGFTGQIKITDFGLAKAKQRVTKTLTGLLKGHPQYMAPEMARGFEIDSRADLFSLGVVLFELFSGQHPWSGENELEIMRLSATDPPKDLLSVRPKLDRELAALVAGLLEKNPDRRISSADAVRARLLAWLDAHGYAEGNDEALGRFVRRNAMRQMRWFERAVTGELMPERPSQLPPEPRGRSRSLARDKSRSNPPPRQLRRHRRGADHDEPRIADPKSDNPTETTDVTDVESKLAGIGVSERLADTRPDSDPRGSSRTPKLLGQVADEPVDWGEEIPTVVQHKDHRDALRPKPASARPAPPTGAPPTGQPSGRPGSGSPLPGYPIADEESDNRTTSVKGRSPAHRSKMPVPSMLDMESDEVPTHPVRGKRQDAVAAAIAAIPKRAPSVLPGSPAQRPGIRGLPPPPAAAGAAKSPRSIPALPPPPAPDRGQGQLAQASMVAQENEPTSLDGPRGMLDHGFDDEEPAVAMAGEVTQELLFQEADRLAVEALRYRDGADAAARLAKHQARLAQLAHDAAAMAAEAVRAASQGALPRGVSLLRDARTLEQTVRREAQVPVEGLPEVDRPKRSFTSKPPSARPVASTSTAPTFAGAAALPASAVAPVIPPSPPLGSPAADPPGPAFPSSPPVALSQPPSSFPAAPAAPTFGRSSLPSEGLDEARLRGGLAPQALGVWDSFAKRDVYGFPAPLAVAVGAVLLVLIASIIGMLAR